MKTPPNLQRAQDARNRVANDVVDDALTVAVRIPRSELRIVETPVRATQRNAESVFGIPKRTFLDLAREYGRDGGEVLPIGKLRSVEVAAFDRWLRRRAPVPSSTPAPNDSEDTLLEDLGLVAAGGRGR